MESKSPIIASNIIKLLIAKNDLAFILLKIKEPVKQPAVRK